MSRRVRQEAEKVKELDEELRLEEEKIKQQKERICAPLFWKRLGSGIRIQDLKPNYFDQVLGMIEEYYIPEEVLCRNSDMKNDPKSVTSFLNKVLFNLKDTTSLIALDEPNEDRIAGFLVLKVVNRSDFGRVFSSAQLVDGDAHKKCVTFTSNLSRKSEIFDRFGCESFLRYYLLCISPEYRAKGLGFQLMLTGVDVARSLNLEVIMGTFSCFSLQKLAKRIGMKVIFEVLYIDWRDRFGEMIFEEPGIGNYTCAIMAGELPPLPVPDPSLAKKSEEEETVKLTREEKRKAKAKAKAKKQ